MLMKYINSNTKRKNISNLQTSYKPNWWLICIYDEQTSNFSNSKLID